MGKFSKKGNLSPKCRSHYEDPELILYFISLLRKMQNTFSELAVSLIWQMGNFPKKEIFQQVIDNYF